MNANSAPAVSRMQILRSPTGSTATWRFCAADTSADPRNGGRPLVVVPGGPGLPHGYLRSLVTLARPGRPVVFYDPVGCGQSQADDDDDAVAYSLTALVNEFRGVVEHFAEPNGCFVLGHSSGGWVALEAMLGDAGTRSRVAKLVLASVPLDVPAFVAAQVRLIESLGFRARRRLRHPPPTLGRGSAAYSRCYERFLHAFICRPPWPPELAEAMARSNRKLYETLWGPSEVCVTGELRTWSCADRVGALDMPILLTSGRHDEVTPDLMEQALQLLPTARWRVFESSAHMSHLEEPQSYNDTVDTFLRQPT